MIITREMRRQLERDNLRQPETLQPIPKEQWPAGGTRRTAVLRSRHFLVQVFEETNGVIRLSVNRTKWDPVLCGWAEGITWDELQCVKREAGFGDRYAIEIYPPDRDVVNVANMRHLWLPPAPLNIGWTHEHG